MSDEEKPPEPEPLPSFGDLRRSRGDESGSELVKRGRGRPLGSKDTKPRTVTERFRKSQALKSWKNGKYAQLATTEEGRLELLRRIDPTLPALIEQAVAAVGGNLEGFQQTGAVALVELEVLRRVLMDQIHDDGVVVEDVTRDIKSKEEIPTETIRLKAHPLLDHARRLHKELGFTATDMRVTKKSQGAGNVDDAKAALLRRKALLQSGRRRMNAPAAPPGIPGKGLPIDVTPAHVAKRR